MARAQQRAINRIDWLVFGTSVLGPIDKTWRDALAQRGFVQGRNIDVTFRYANAVPTRLPELARELAAQKPDLLIGVGGDMCGRCLMQVMALRWSAALTVLTDEMAATT